ncbi:MAG: RelE-like cytotoxic translational repressor of toxin-antitoxin stability system [Firmicutes bacterium]|nr:RelE-like cytotoxic translational repressor of toxin-antitoxin stability system [Bacillota bacterium]
MEKIPIVIAETKSFIRSITSIWEQDDLDGFKDYIARNYESGDIISNTNGIRKIRWYRPGMGKRGGTRIIYYYYDINNPVFLLYAYPKNAQENLTPDEKKELRGYVEILKNQLRRNTNGE